MHFVKQKLWQNCTFLSSQAEFSFLPGYVRRIHAQKVKKEEGWACDFFMSLFFGSGQVEKCPPPDLLSLFLGTLPPSKVFGRGGGRVKSAQETETQEERRKRGRQVCHSDGQLLLLFTSTFFRPAHPFSQFSPAPGREVHYFSFSSLKRGPGRPRRAFIMPFSPREPPTAVTSAPSQKAVHFRRVMPVWEKCTGSSSITPADGRLAMPRPAERNC